MLPVTANYMSCSCFSLASCSDTKGKMKIVNGLIIRHVTKPPCSPIFPYRWKPDKAETYNFLHLQIYIEVKTFNKGYLSIIFFEIYNNKCLLYIKH